MTYCVQGKSEKEIDELRSRIPNFIETQMAVADDEDHSQYNQHKERGWCEKEFVGHHPCKRLGGHKGKHWCFECGYSWSVGK